MRSPRSKCREKRAPRGRVGGRGWWALKEEEAARRRGIIVTAMLYEQKCISRDVKHSRSFYSDNDDGTQHEDCPASSPVTRAPIAHGGPEGNGRPHNPQRWPDAVLSPSNTLLFLPLVLIASFWVEITMRCREAGSLARIQGSAESLARIPPHPSRSPGLAWTLASFRTPSLWCRCS